MSQLGPTELLILLVIVLLVLGPKRLPSLARQLGGGIREFRNSIGGGSGEDDDKRSEEVRRGMERQPPKGEHRPVDEAAPPAADPDRPTS